MTQKETETKIKIVKEKVTGAETEKAEVKETVTETVKKTVVGTVTDRDRKQRLRQKPIKIVNKTRRKTETRTGREEVT